MTVARDFHRKVNAYCRAAESVKRAVRCGVDVIYHCEHADEEALDMLEAVKDCVLVGPAIGLLHAAVHEAPEGALHAGVRRGYDLGLAAAARTYLEMKQRGIRVVIGGDYGFARRPQGENARDIEHFVRYIGYSPGEALVCATRNGAELMGDHAGQVREGFAASSRSLIKVTTYDSSRMTSATATRGTPSTTPVPRGTALKGSGMTTNAHGPETPSTRPDRLSYEEALAERGVLEVLAPFDPGIGSNSCPC